MDYMNALPDVYFVTVAQSVEFARNPRAIEAVEPETTLAPEPETTVAPETTAAPEITLAPEPETTVAPEVPEVPEVPARSPIFDECKVIREADCQARLCELIKESTDEIRWMTICNSICPPLYPWVGNPLGEILSH